MNNTNTVVCIKIQGSTRNEFIDPPAFDWNYEQDRKLWSLISTLEKQEDIGWESLSKQLNAPVFFLRKRTYKLFSSHLKSLERELHRVSINDLQSGLGIDDRMYSPQNDTVERVQVAEKKLQSALDKNESQQNNRRKLLRDDDAQNASGNSDLSSLSFSKSALEEALMDRLQL